MKYVYDPNHKELNRYVIVTYMDGGPCIFKRYGTEPESVKREFIKFVHEEYQVYLSEHDIEIKEDPSHPVEYNVK